MKVRWRLSRELTLEQAARAMEPYFDNRFRLLFAWRGWALVLVRGKRREKMGA